MGDRKKQPAKQPGEAEKRPEPTDQSLEQAQAEAAKEREDEGGYQ